MKTIKPRKLKKGDTIGILAVSGRIKEFEKIENASNYLKDKGYNVIISETCRFSHRYMAGKNDEELINTFHKFFLNEEISAILCARGGYGTLRLVNNIDWQIVQNNPKIFAGYSDITTLLNLIYKKTGLITFHSPMANGDFGDKVEDYTENSFFNTLEGTVKEYKAEDCKTLNSGICEGKLWGGNLATLASLCGSDFVPDQNLILFLEDLNEPIYKIDRYLTQLFNIEKIAKNVKGIAFGEFKDIEDNKTLEELEEEIAKKYKIPACSGFKITHNKIKDTIPIGINAIFNADEGLISLTDTYVN